jgi:hypothetical protein
MIPRLLSAPDSSRLRRVYSNAVQSQCKGGEDGIPSEFAMSEKSSKPKRTMRMGIGTGTVSVLGVPDADLQAMVRDLDHAGMMVPPDHEGANIERLLALAHSGINPDAS